MVYSIKQRVFLVETYTKYSSYGRCRRKFFRHFPGVCVPSRSMIERLVKKFRSTGSVLDKKKNRKRSVLTEEKLDEIGALLEKSPRQSLASLAAQSGVSLGSAQTATRLLKLKNTGIIKMENDVDVLNENDSVCKISDEVHVQSALSIKKDETEIMNIKLEDFADTQEEEDPLGELPLIKSEHEASINLQKVIPDSYSGTCLESSYDDDQIIDIKVEGVVDVKVEEDPFLITSPVIKAEHEVSCVSIVRYIASPFVCPHEANLLC
ncbi:uncharacterized protein LOC110830569 isoform X2 [Zootermopsis nevadensis]|uniref:uncharacterized protein LOC110830569 isoform X2 n=1 Tax=Zootermopsis nevadensis TaxID=136037 RepID=UPI000B8E2F45|nr:uncharacterized protein LOC110830569 isoform X2 [Zootermopsis nevadensis]